MPTGAIATSVLQYLYYKYLSYVINIARQWCQNDEVTYAEIDLILTCAIMLE